MEGQEQSSVRGGLAIRDAVRLMEGALVALNQATRPAKIVEDGARFFVRYEPPLAVGTGLIQEDFMITDEPSSELFEWIRRNSHPLRHILTIFADDERAGIERCERLGYTHGASERLMRLELPARFDGAPAHAVVRVRTHDDLERVRACGGLPIHGVQLESDGIRQYAVEAEGEVASRGMLVVAGDGMAFVTAMHTNPAHRRRGMASSILRRMIEDAAALGMQDLMLKSTPAAARLYESMGFQTVCMVVSFSREERESESVTGARISVAPRDRLRVPHPRRLVHEERAQSDGSPSLLLFYSNKEISFDEPELIPFGRGLLQNPTFVAESACGWADEAPHTWDRVKPLLETLLEEEILESVEDESQLPGSGQIMVERTSTGAPGVEPVDRPDPSLCWSRAQDRCAELGERATGLAFELNQLESFILIYRIAHPALDTEGRQLGEASVRNGLLQPIRTEWRLCKYPGSRFQAGPMNMTALRSLQRHWPSVQAWAALLRDEFVRRNRLGPEPLSLGDIFLFSCAVLAMPAYLLMRSDNPLRGGEIDTALASLFRIIDGLRFPAEFMIFGVKEWPAERDWSERITTSQFLHYVEKTNLFEGGESGMCSGPPRMVEEFLDFVFTGRGSAFAPADLEAERVRLIRVIGDLDAAFAYGAAGLLVYCHRRWFDVHEVGVVRALRERIRADGASDPGVLEPIDAWLADSERRVQWNSEASAKRTLRDFVSRLRMNVPDGLALPEFGAVSARDRERGVRTIRERATAPLPAGVIEALADALISISALEIEHMHAVDGIQERINLRLARAPSRAVPYRRRQFEAASRRTLATSVIARLAGVALDESPFAVSLLP